MPFDFSGKGRDDRVAAPPSTFSWVEWMLLVLAQPPELERALR
ncbi:hypothetical protein ACPOL_4226 [Acidisarcina polymorpha]|uniref:Uncharacterized protein n=1 Tax=Acidisarcina polymorpha TaxID=2211140 RepID=A0A2Z5G2R8_9BACT|nr:hypothetical protein ACPOL_4226 [Acidisarcina polymorpha]